MSKIIINGNKYNMRDINLKDINGTIARLNAMRGIPLVVKVNRGRNKIETYEGVIESVYPNVFTVKCVGGEIGTFQHADVLARNILFFRKKE